MHKALWDRISIFSTVKLVCKIGTVERLRYATHSLGCHLTL